MRVQVRRQPLRTGDRPRPNRRPSTSSRGASPEHGRAGHRRGAEGGRASLFLVEETTSRAPSTTRDRSLDRPRLETESGRRSAPIGCRTRVIHRARRTGASLGATPRQWRRTRRASPSGQHSTGPHRSRTCKPSGQKPTGKVLGTPSGSRSFSSQRTRRSDRPCSIQRTAAARRSSRRLSPGSSLFGPSGSLGHVLEILDTAHSSDTTPVHDY